MACEFCSETNFYLSDLEALGPCVCVTPEAMRDLWEMYRDAEGDVRRLSDVEDDLATATARIDELKGAEIEANEAAGIMGDAFDHLAAYLTRLGLSSRAVKLDDPDLDALLKILGD